MGPPEPNKPAKCPEDVCLALTSYAASDIIPPSTRDDSTGNKERFHFRNPHDMYHLPVSQTSWIYRIHEQVGGISSGIDCCSPYSITFHHMNTPPYKGYMEYVEQQLYKCRRQ